VLDSKKGSKPLGDDIFHMNMRDIEKNGVSKSLHRMLGMLLNLEQGKEMDR
jgi:hypothetical protein